MTNMQAVREWSDVDENKCSCVVEAGDWYSTGDYAVEEHNDLVEFTKDMIRGLLKFGRHRDYCRSGFLVWRHGDKGFNEYLEPCTCGLEPLLRRTAHIPLRQEEPKP